MATSPRRKYHASSPFQPAPTVLDEVYEVGARVTHNSLGLGRVVSIEGTRSAQIDFGSGPQHILLPCAAMTNL